jgi:cytidine deaminase
MEKIKNDDLLKLSQAAWKVRDSAFIFGDTKVGAAILTESGKIFSGCNVEHMFRSHDIHAEVNAISNMVAAGENKIKAILITAEREFFTPCGSCMDWIMQFAEEDCIVGFQNTKGKEIVWFNHSDLMPYYPK